MTTKLEHSKRTVPRPRLSDAPKHLHTLIKPPSIAWPTLLLMLVAGTSMITAITCAINGTLNFFQAGAIVGISHYLIFTVLHDAVHRAISSKWDWINNRTGDLAGIFMLPVLFTGANFRYMHIQHHRFANDGPNLDPDDWAGGGSAWTLPLRWLTIPYRYIWFYAKKSTERPTKEKLHIAISSLIGLIIIILMIMQGWGETLLWVYLLPAHLSFGFLAFAFDWLPHFPHDVSENTDPYKATSIREGASWLLTPLLLGQNYHLLHHLYPRVPFYRYSQVWFGMRTELIKKGSKVVSPLGRIPVD